MLAIAREKLNSKLWQYYKSMYLDAKVLPIIDGFILDHLAIIELPSEYSGINYLRKIFSKLGYTQRGEGYLEEKSNDFIWMAANDCEKKTPEQSLPQLVLADFRLPNLSPLVQEIVQGCTNIITPINFAEIDELQQSIASGDIDAIDTMVQMLFEHLTQRAWSAPTLEEYDIVRQENELLAWVLAFGRMINHYGISLHNKSTYPNFRNFIADITKTKHVKLNHVGGIIKGSPKIMIEQAATQGVDVCVPFKDGTLQLPGAFIEFVWRHPLKANPILWKDYYTGFIPANADNIIESLYAEHQ